MNTTYTNFMQLVKQIEETDVDSLQGLLDDIARETAELSRTDKILLVTLIRAKLDSPNNLN